MASRVSLIQSRSIYVGTLNSVAPSDGNLIVTGSVGIGTTAPTAKLHVEGPSADGTPVFIVNGTTAPNYFNYAGSIMNSDLGSSRNFILLIGKAQSNRDSGYIGFNHSGTNGSNSNFLTFGLFQNDNIMNITGAGNVGIGTTSPGDKLQVDGTIWAKPTSNGTLGTALRLGVFADSASTAAYEFKTNDSTDDFLGLYSNRWGINYEIHRDSSAGDKYVWSVYGDDNGHIMQLYNGSNTNSVRLSSFSSSWLNGGNVGIGTTSPSSLLSLSKTGLVDFQLNASDQATDEKNWVWQAGAPVGTGVYRLRAVNDAYTNGVNALTFTRSGISSVTATFSSSVEATSFIKTSGTSSQYLMADGSVSTTSNVAPRYVQTINVSQTGYTTICTITGGSLASAVNMSFQGTSNNVVVNVTAQILVNHSGDISITTTSGFYSQLNIRVISNNNETYSVEAQVVSGMASTTDLNIEVFPLNSESVTFGGSPTTPGTTLVHTTRQGLYISASEGISISSGNDIYAAGNVGVGTTNPNAPLHVIKDLGTSVSAVARLRGSNSTARTTRLQFEDYNGTLADGLIDFVIPTAGSATGARLDIGVDSAIVSVVRGGNVGIGTTSPDTPLFVQGGPAGTGSWNRTATLSATYPGLIFNSNGTKWGGMAYDYSAAMRFWVNASNNDIFAGTLAMSIANNGNVLIGTTTDNGDKLQVSGATTINGSLYLRGGSRSIVGDGGDLLIDTENVAGRDILLQTQSGQNVGINTTTPSTKLEVNGGTIGNSIARFTTGGAGGGTRGVTITSDNSQVKLQVSDNAGSVGSWAFLNLNPDGGNVGIGTTSPDAKLVVVGSGTGVVKIGDAGFGSGNYTGISLNGTLSTSNYNILSSPTDSTLYINRPTGATIQFRENNTTQVIIAASGNVGIGTTSPAANLHIQGSNAKIRLTGDTHTSIELEDGGTGDPGYLKTYYYGSLVAQVGAGGTFFNTGNVGIGTASPDYKLQISDTAANGRAIQAVQTATSGTNYGGVIAAEGSGATQNVGLYVNAIGATTNYAAIFANGNVGIGTTSPGSKLDIDRDGRTGSHATSQSLYVTGTMGGGTTGGQSGNIEFRHSNGSQGIGFGYQTIYQTGDNTNEVLNILSRGTGALTLNAYAYSSGNVGVGTVSPSEKLHISGNVVVDYNSSYQGINSIGNKAILARVSPTTGIINYAEYATATNLNGFVLGSDDARVKGDIATDSLDFITNTSSRMFINSSGNVGIATTSPSYKLDVVGDSRITSGSLGVGVAPNATDGRVDASNDIVAYSTSDQRLKENVTPIENALEKVKTLTGVEFDWKEETAHVHGYHGHDVGIIAQDVQAVLPEAVRTNDSGYLSVRYEKMIALLIEANKELAARVELLEQKLKQ